MFTIWSQSSVNSGSISCCLNRSNCSFAQHQLEYLGHIISDAGLATDLTKVTVMMNWPIPTAVTELRGFLGLTGYYQWFVKGYGLLVNL